MYRDRLQIVICGLSITSSWGNGHATTYRALVRGLSALGHDVLFLERDAPWYAANRDLARPPYGRVALYQSLGELKDRFQKNIREADLVIVGSYVPEGIAVGEWVLKTAKNATAFYDIDTPVTLAALRRQTCGYLTPRQIASYDMYLSFTGGPILREIEQLYGSPMACVLYCAVDQELYFPESTQEPLWDLGYLGTYSEDRQPALQSLLVEAALEWKQGCFTVVGALFPDNIPWPKNVQRMDHLPPQLHREFYNHQRFTLNVTRADMVRAGYSPSVRLFEAAACGVPVISDHWRGLDELFAIGSEILISRSSADTLRYLTEMSDDQRRAIGAKARAAVLRRHTYQHRANELTSLAWQVLEQLAIAPSSRMQRLQIRRRNGASSGSKIPQSAKRPAVGLCNGAANRTTRA